MLTQIKQNPETIQNTFRFNKGLFPPVFVQIQSAGFATKRVG